MARIPIPHATRRSRQTPAQWLAEWEALPPAERWRAAGECLCCHAAIRDQATATHVHMLTTGELADQDETPTEAEDQGYFPVGPECARLLPASFRFSPQHVYGVPPDGA